MKKLLLKILKFICDALPEIQMNPPKHYGIRKPSDKQLDVSIYGQGQTKKFGSRGSGKHK